jgi:hypothetical protein
MSVVIASKKKTPKAKQSTFVVDKNDPIMLCDGNKWNCIALLACILTEMSIDQALTSVGIRAVTDTSIRHWEDSEIDYLIDNHIDQTENEIADKLDMPLDMVLSKIRQLMKDGIICE